MRFLFVRRLIRLRRSHVPPAVLEAARARLEEAMRATPMAAFVQVRTFAWKPAMIALVVVVAFAGSGTVWASQGSLPGDALYSVKMASEEIRAAVAFGTSAKLKTYANRAERRLDEAERILAAAEARKLKDTTRLQVVMRSYERHVFRLNEMAVKIGSEERISPKAAAAAVEAADRVLRHHEALVVEAATASSIVIEATAYPLELEANVYLQPEQVSWEDERDDDGKESRKERRYREAWERNERLREELRQQADRLREAVERWHVPPVEMLQPEFAL